MSVVVIGVNQRSAPLSVLERLTLSAAELPKSVTGLASRDNIREVVVLSTCNRTEIYAITEKFHAASVDITEFLCELGGITLEEIQPHIFMQHDDAAVRHLFEVAAGLDSAVLGESEILGQIHDAWEVARREFGARTTLNLMFRHAIEVGKRVRTETAIGRGTSSVSHAAVEMAIEHHGSIEGRRICVVGAGAMGEGITVALHRAGVGDVVIVNRSPENGHALAERVGGVSVGLDRLAEAIASADLVLTCTGAGAPIVTSDIVKTASRGGRPLLIVDIAVPRDVATSVAALPDVTVLDIDDLAKWAERSRNQRLTEVDRVREIIAEELDRFGMEVTALQAVPLVTALRERAESLRLAELDRYDARISELDDDQRALIDMITRGIITKLLHEPSVRLRNQAGSPRGERNAASVTDLFDLG